MRQYIIFTLFLASIACCPPADALAARPGAPLSIYALRNGADSIYEGKPFTWLAYLVVKGDRRILIDTGFSDEDWRKRYGIPRLYGVPDLLRQAGVPPEGITDVILTHAHVDHAGNIGLFPNARLFLREEELAAIKAQPLLAAQLAKVPAGNIMLVPDTLQPVPGVTITHAGGHTPGSCIITVDGDSRVLFSGDNCYQREGCRYNAPGTIVLTHHDPAILRGARHVSDNVFLVYRP